MGRRKLFLDVAGKPLLRWAVEGVLRHVDDAVIVTGADASGAREALAGLSVRFTANPRPEDGQGSSIAVGIAALRAGTRAALVALGDQPWVPAGVVPALLEVLGRRQGGVVAPVYQDVQGTPVLFGADVFPELLRLTGDAGAKSVVQSDPARVELVRFDVAMPADVDTPEDYARLAAARTCEGARRSALDGSASCRPHAG
jgi:molybdenum cofactor cytidylyltransferase